MSEYNHSFLEPMEIAKTVRKSIPVEPEIAWKLKTFVDYFQESLGTNQPSWYLDGVFAV
jgi:hypothetical protein